MPLLIIFGAFLAVRSVTLGTGMASPEHPDASSIAGLNFLWTPQFDSLSNPTVWLNAAGQIFFTLSVGMGTVHCYAAYVKQKDDIALNAMSAGWMNEFVEVVFGSMIVIPLAAGYFGVDWLKGHANFGMAFRTMPFLFEQWGGVLSALAGLMWFGLLFFAGITSSLAMGTPWLGFMQDEFGWKRNRSAWSFGLIVLLLGLPTVLIYNISNGAVNSYVFGEYDYWAGTVSLVVFALLETILFVWVFGLVKGWDAINSGGDIRVPNFYKPIIKWITPLLLLCVFIGSLITPEGNDWKNAFKNGWKLDNGSIIKTIGNSALKADIEKYRNANPVLGGLEAIRAADADDYDPVLDVLIREMGPVASDDTKNIERIQQEIESTYAEDPAKMDAINAAVADSKTQNENTVKQLERQLMFTNLARILLVALFVAISGMVYVAYKKRLKEGRLI